MANKSKQTRIYENAIKNWPIDERPREKLLRFGEHTLTGRIIDRTNILFREEIDPLLEETSMAHYTIFKSLCFILEEKKCFGNESLRNVYFHFGLIIEMVNLLTWKVYSIKYRVGLENQEFIPALRENEAIKKFRLSMKNNYQKQYQDFVGEGRPVVYYLHSKREGFEIFKVYQDDGISGYTKETSALKELLEDAKDKKFYLVLVYKIDRFSRNLKDLLSLVDELSSYGVGFKSATEPLGTTTSAGKLMFQQLGSFAEFERNRIAERVFPGMIKGVQQGNWQGARYAPYGYRYNKEKKLLEIDEKERA